MTNYENIAFITGITGQDGSFIAKFLLKKNYIVHGFIRKTATGNLQNIQDILNKQLSNLLG